MHSPFRCMFIVDRPWSCACWSSSIMAAYLYAATTCSRTFMSKWYAQRVNRSRSTAVSCGLCRPFNSPTTSYTRRSLPHMRVATRGLSSMAGRVVLGCLFFLNCDNPRWPRRCCSTDTIRSTSPDSVAFVRAMSDPSTKDSERFELLRTAINAHLAFVKEVLQGRGIDRHMMGLYILSEMSGMCAGGIFRCLWYFAIHMLCVGQVSSRSHQFSLRKASWSRRLTG